MIKEPIHIPPFVQCPGCKNMLSVDDRVTIDYFLGNETKCGECNNGLDWWKVIRNAIKENFMLNGALSAIGANSIALNVTLVSGVMTAVRFQDYGIPEDAKILYINYTPYTNGGDGGLFPLEVHYNIPYRHSVPNEMKLYPMPLGKGEPGKDSGTSILATWVPHTPDDVSWTNLVDAFYAYVGNRYLDAIFPANVAVESALSSMLSAYLINHSSREHVESFLQQAATYGHQLNVLLPVITDLKNLPKIPDHIRGQLNKLRKYRNQTAHDGRTEKDLTKDDTAEIICGALFGFRYIQLIKEQLLKT